MTINEFWEKNKNLFKIKDLKGPVVLGLIKEDTKVFKFPGVYFLVDENEKIVYIGSSYVRRVRIRVMQYQQKRGTGNDDLYCDLINAKFTDEANAESYIKKLKVHAYEDRSLEYKLIELAEGIANSIIV